MQVLKCGQMMFKLLRQKILSRTRKYGCNITQINIDEH
jgi:hypothetical protein